MTLLLEWRETTSDQIAISPTACRDRSARQSSPLTTLSPSTMTPAPLSYRPAIDFDRVGISELSINTMATRIASRVPTSRAKPKIRIVSRPRKPKTLRAAPVLPANAAQQRSKPACKHSSKRQRKSKCEADLSVAPLHREVWGQFPTPLDRKRFVPEDVSEWLISGHRWFKPQLVHQTLFNLEGQFESALQFMYRTWMGIDHLRRLYADVHEYIADVPDDVFAIDPDRFLKIRPGQVIQLENPSGSPVFIHQKPALDVISRVSEPATLSVYSDTSTIPAQLKLVLNDAALQLWGYTQEQFEVHLMPNNEDAQVKILPFFCSLFSDPTIFTIIALDLAVFYLRCKFASFRCNIMRRDGKLVPVLARFTIFLHAKHLNVSQFSFTDLSAADMMEASSCLLAEAIIDHNLPVLDLPMLPEHLLK